MRKTNELAYRDLITDHLPENEYFGEDVKEKLIYYPTVTREKHHYQGRITDLIQSGKLFDDLDMPTLDPAHDRAMICGSPSMLKDSCNILVQLGFKESRHGQQGSFVIERAFVET